MLGYGRIRLDAILVSLLTGIASMILGFFLGSSSLNSRSSLLSDAKSLLRYNDTEAADATLKLDAYSPEIYFASSFAQSSPSMSSSSSSSLSSSTESLASLSTSKASFGAAAASTLPALDNDEDPAWAPFLPSTVECSMQQDGADVCLYTNACVQVPDGLFPRKKWKDYTLTLFTDAKIEAALEARRAGAGGARFASLRKRWPGWSIGRLASSGYRGEWATSHVDYENARPGARPRIMPYSLMEYLPIATRDIREYDDSESALWMDDLYLAKDALGSNLWVYASSVLSPLLGLVNSNQSGSLPFVAPSLRNVLYIGPLSDTAPQYGSPLDSSVGSTAATGPSWQTGALTSALSYITGSEPFLGSRIALPASGKEERGRARRINSQREWLQEIGTKVERSGSTLPRPFLTSESSRAVEATLLCHQFASWSRRADTARFFSGTSEAQYSASASAAAAREPFLAPCEEEGEGALTGNAFSSPPDPLKESTRIFAIAAEDVASLSPEEFRFAQRVWCIVKRLSRPWDSKRGTASAGLRRAANLFVNTVRSDADAAADADEADSTESTRMVSSDLSSSKSPSDASDKAILSVASSESIVSDGQTTTEEVEVSSGEDATTSSRAAAPWRSKSRAIRESSSPRYIPNNRDEAIATRALDGPPVRLIFDVDDLPPLPANLAAMEAAIVAAAELLGEDPRAIWQAAHGITGSVNSSVAMAVCDPSSDGGDAARALSTLISLPSLSLLAHWLEHRPTQICAQRLIMPGAKASLVGGNAEGGIFRDLGLHARLRAAAQEHPRQKKSIPSPAPAQKGRWGAPASKAAAIEQPRVLLIDRTHPAPTTKSYNYTRSFYNRREMEAVLAHYNVAYTLLLDSELGSFDEQAAFFSHFKLLIGGHGAGLTNAIFMPPRSAIVEISPVNMWCPCYLKAAVLAGHAFFPIYSRLLPPQQAYTVLGRDWFDDAGLVRMRETCERRGPVQATVYTEDCWKQAKAVPIVTPIHEFEAVLLEALDAVGINRQHRGSLFHMLHGVPGEGEDTVERIPLLAHMQPDFYEQRRWAICPRGTTAEAMARATQPRPPWQP